MNIELQPRPWKTFSRMKEAALPEKANILLVDDRPENLYAMEVALKDLGQNLLRAGSGEQALKHLLHTPVAVILLDVNMPGMDGFELAAMIRERSESRRTPIIFITGYNLPEANVIQGYSLGAVDYIVKPFSPEILKSKVAIFVDLFKKTAQIKKQAEALQKYNEELTAEISERQLAQAQLKFQADILAQV